jgi:hypothetical protein
MDWVFLVCRGDGSDGFPWEVVGIFTTRALAEEFITRQNARLPQWEKLRVEDIEEWPVNKSFDPKRYPDNNLKTD